MTDEQQALLHSTFVEMEEKLECYAKCVLGSSGQMAEDYVMDTFYIACTHIDIFCGSENPRGWLMNVLKNVMRNASRKRENMLKMVQIITDGARRQNEAAYEQDIDVRLLYLDLANTKEFKLITKLAVDGYSMSELAEYMSMDIAACRKAVQRAREFLAEKIGAIE